MGFVLYRKSVMMTSLRGRAHIKIDSKGRISLPTSFRGGLGKSNQIYVTNNLYRGHHFLDLCTAAEWLKLEKKIAQMPSLKSEVQAYQRFYISSAELCPIDSQSRILIPPHLREFAKLKEDIVLVGVGGKIEIWSDLIWRQLFGELEKDFERVIGVISDIDQSNGHKK